MKDYIEKLYQHSPIFLQDIIISLYGLKIYNERFSDPWKKHYQNLLVSQYLTEDEIYALQISKLKEFIEHSIKYVKYYRDIIKLDQLEYVGNDQRIILDKIPILTKNIVRNNPNQFISEFYNPDKLIILNTSGTTGTPLSVYIDPVARKLNYAFFERSKNWAGIRGFQPSVTFAGRTVVSPEQDVPPFWRKNVFMNNTLFSSYHLSDLNIPFYIKEILKIKPTFIDSYPSSIERIAEYCLMNGVDSIRPKAIITSAETLFDHQRDKIESAFDCKVYDQYGCTEQAVFVCQCEYGSYHVNMEYGILEVLDMNDKPVRPGEVGDFVCTGFTNLAMPLIRYRIGDMGIISEKKCECGRSFPVIEKIYGRNDELLLTPEGRYIGRLDPIFKGVRNTIKEAQIVQEATDHVVIYIVKGVGYEDRDGEYIVHELRKRMGSSLEYSLSYLDRIPRTKNGKFRAVINKLLINDKEINDEN